MADQAGRSELGVTFHKFEPQPTLFCDGPQDGGFAGSRRTLQQNMAAGRQGSHHHLQLFFTSDHMPVQPVEKPPVKL